MTHRKKIHLANSANIENDINEIIQEICELHSTGDIANDIIALFEDIIKHFSGREDEFIPLKSMPKKDQEEMYNEITTIINIIRSLGNAVDKNEIMSIMSKRLIDKFSKSKSKHKEKSFVDREEQNRIKQIFASMALHELQLDKKRVYKELPYEKKLEHLKTGLKKAGAKEVSKATSFKEKEMLSKMSPSKHRSV